MQPQPTDLLITFRLVPGINQLEALLPNGARFIVAPHEVHGKLGENLDLFRRAVTPKSNDFNVKIYTATPGLRTDKVKREREIQDALAALEIEI